MFNKKLKQELARYKEEVHLRGEEIIKLKRESDTKSKEISALYEFNKKIDSKIEELCKPKINDFCLSMVGTGIVVSTSSFNVLSKKFTSIEEAFESQAREIENLKERDEDNKKILFLSAKVEQLINKLNTQ